MVKERGHNDACHLRLVTVRFNDLYEVEGDEDLNNDSFALGTSGCIRFHLVDQQGLRLRR